MVKSLLMNIFTLLSTGSALIGNLYAEFFTDRYGAKIGFMAYGLVIIILMLLISSVTKSVYKDEKSTNTSLLMIIVLYLIFNSVCM